MQVPESLTTTVDVSLERVTGAPVVPAVAPPPRRLRRAPAENELLRARSTSPLPKAAHGRSRVLPIATTAGAVVLAGTGVAMFLVAGSAQTNAQEDCATKLTCDDRRARVRTFDALALGGFIGAVGLGVVSVILWTSKPSEQAAANARLQAGPGTFALEGSF